MSIVRWNPFQELEELSRLLAKSSNQVNQETWSPAVDIVETEKDYQIKAEIPGVNKDDIKVYIENGVLHIAGQRRIEKEEKDKKYHRVERMYGTFQRSFSVPENVNVEKPIAEFKDGILQVSLPKQEQEKPRSIEVKVA